MSKVKLIWTSLWLLTALSGFSYRFEAGEYYVGGGLGLNINVARFDKAPRETPKADLPIIAHFDYIIDERWGVFSSFIPQFAPGSMSFSFRGGAKYRFTGFDAPYVPYVSLALAPSFLVPMSSAPAHFNIGLSPGVGLNFFVLAKFLVGAHIHFNPSLAISDGERRFEFSVMPSIDVSLRL